MENALIASVRSYGDDQDSVWSELFEERLRNFWSSGSNVDHIIRSTFFESFSSVTTDDFYVTRSQLFGVALCQVVCGKFC